MDTRNDCNSKSVQSYSSWNEKDATSNNVVNGKKRNNK